MSTRDVMGKLAGATEIMDDSKKDNLDVKAEGKQKEPRSDHSEIEETKGDSIVEILKERLVVSETQLRWLHDEYKQMRNEISNIRTRYPPPFMGHLPKKVKADPNQPQEATIRCVPTQRWREVKPSGGYDPNQPVLLISVTIQETSAPDSDSSWSEVDAVTNDKHQQPNVEGKLKRANTLSNQSSNYEIPYRLAINSAVLMKALERIISQNLVESQNVWIRPFKYLIRYEDQIRAAVREAEKEFEDAELEYKKLLEAAKSDGASQGVKSVGEPVSTGIGPPPPPPGLFLPTVYGPDSEPLPPSPPLKLPEEMRFEEAKTLRAHLTCLETFIDTHMSGIFKLRDDIKNTRVSEIAFQDLWHLFSPGDVVLARDPLNPSLRQAFRVLHVTGGRPNLDKNNFIPMLPPPPPPPGGSRRADDTESMYRHVNMTPLRIDFFFLDFNGRTFEPTSRLVTIREYTGRRPIKDLEAYPIAFDPDASGLREHLIARGKRFQTLVNGAHKRYRGRCIQEPQVQAYLEEVNSEIVIDHNSARDYFTKKFKQWYGFSDTGVDVIAKSIEPDRRETFEHFICIQPHCRECSDIYNDREYDQHRRTEFIIHTDLLEQRLLSETLTDEHYMLLPQRVYGYALSGRKWHPLNIDLVHDIEEPEHGTPFDQLVLPKTHRELIQALIKNQMGHFGKSPEGFSLPRGTSSDDLPFELVRGKGRGLIILLHGVPGVGKTSTAECVAAQLRRPLFPITCGDLGTDAEQVEARLEEYFTLASKWRSVLLLDEADVFLAKRERGDIDRNSLVSVFLRELEYYSGVLILTTNRVGEFDEGFRSRIHISLYYSTLDKESTFAIWEMNLQRLKDSSIAIDVEEEKIRKFVRKHWDHNVARPTHRWNGRQIRNSWQTAIALANRDFYDGKERGSRERPLLRAKHFRKVAETSKDFDDYLVDVLGQEEGYSALAYNQHLRSDAHRQEAVQQKARGAAAHAKLSGRTNLYESDSSSEEDSSEEEESAEKSSGESDSDLEAKIKALKKRQKEKDKEKSKKEKDKERLKKSKGKAKHDSKYSDSE